MSTLKETILKYSILNEGFKFDTAEAAATAIVNKKVGVKVAPDFLLNDPQTSEMKKNTLVRILDRFYRNTKSMGIDDPTYGVQFLISHTSDIDAFSKAANNDAIFEYLKSYKKPWVKQLSSYNDFVNKPFNENNWHTFEKQVQDEQNKHGKKSKGTGDTNGVKILYPKDSDGWELKIPLNFAGERAAAYYGKEGEKEEPTHWCTRVGIEFYNQYTDNNTHPLYIIRNYKTGKSYQFVVTNELVHGSKIHFLDQDDVNGDEVTAGDLSKIPDKLLSLIKMNGSNKTLLGYKKAPTKIAHENEKGYTDKKTTFKDGVPIDEKTINDFLKTQDDNCKEVFKEIIEKYGPVMKSVSKNGKIIDDGNKKSPLIQYYNTGAKIDYSNSKWGKKMGIRRYYLKKKPELFKEIAGNNNYETLFTRRPRPAFNKENIMSLFVTLDDFLKNKRKNNRAFDDTDEIYEKREEVYDKSFKEIKPLLNKIKAGDFEIQFSNSGFIKSFKYTITFRNIEYYCISERKKGKGYDFFVQNTNEDYNTDDIEYSDKKNDAANVFQPETKKILNKIFNICNKNYHTIFRTKIQNARQEGKFETNAFEENQAEISLVEEISEQIGSMFNY